MSESAMLLTRLHAVRFISEACAEPSSVSIPQPGCAVTRVRTGGP